MVDQSQLKRLAILVAVTAALVFGGLAGYAKYEAYSAQEAVEVWYRNLTKANIECEKDRTSIYCESIKTSKKEFDESVAFRDEREKDAKNYLALAIAIPFACAFLWFGGNWVMTGSARKYH